MIPQVQLFIYCLPTHCLWRKSVWHQGATLPFDFFHGYKKSGQTWQLFTDGQKSWPTYNELGRTSKQRPKFSVQVRNFEYIPALLPCNPCRFADIDVLSCKRELLIFLTQQDRTTILGGILPIFHSFSTDAMVPHPPFFCQCVFGFCLFPPIFCLFSA